LKKPNEGGSLNIFACIMIGFLDYLMEGILDIKIEVIIDIADAEFSRGSIEYLLDCESASEDDRIQN
jgi:hypothetical protein